GRDTRSRRPAAAGEASTGQPFVDVSPTRGLVAGQPHRPVAPLLVGILREDRDRVLVRRCLRSLTPGDRQPGADEGLPGGRQEGVEESCNASHTPPSLRRDRLWTEYLRLLDRPSHVHGDQG